VVMKKNKYITLVLLSFLFGAFVASGFSKESKSVAMSLNLSLDKISEMNPVLKKLKRDRSDGLRTIEGPVNFKFLYGKKETLEFSSAKLVIYQTSDSKIEYIHVFPQQNNLNSDKFKKFLNKLEHELVSLNWEKEFKSKSKNNTVLQDVGIDDYAHYYLEMTSKTGSRNRYEVVLTTFVDANVRCHADKTTSKKKNECQNKFIRLGFSRV